MKVTRSIIFSCGCIATYRGVFQGYCVDEHTCDGKLLEAERNRRVDQAVDGARGSYQRGTVRLYREPFSILRGPRV